MQTRPATHAELRAWVADARVRIARKGVETSEKLFLAFLTLAAAITSFKKLDQLTMRLVLKERRLEIHRKRQHSDRNEHNHDQYREVV